jgi:hypothetical protein
MVNGDDAATTKRCVSNSMGNRLQRKGKAAFMKDTH